MTGRVGVGAGPWTHGCKELGHWSSSFDKGRHVSMQLALEVFACTFPL